MTYSIIIKVTYNLFQLVASKKSIIDKRQMYYFSTYKHNYLLLDSNI